MKEVLEIKRFTQEQESAIACAMKGASLGIIANAGSGKSTTLLGIATEHCLNDKTGLYLAFNKAVKESAETKFSKFNTKVKTVYGLGYGHIVGQGLINKSRIGNVTTKHLANFLKMKGQDEFVIFQKLYDFLVSRNDKRAELFVVKGLKLAALVMKTLQNYLHSSDLRISVDHTELEDLARVLKNDLKLLLSDQNLSSNKDIKNHIACLVENHKSNLEPLSVFMVSLVYDVINDMHSWEGNLSVMHDVYLKYYANLLASGDIKPPKVDYVMFDEFQDANGVMLALVDSLRKTGSQIIAVGDPHQRIYSFLHTKDAFASTTFDEYRLLSKSFRFGHEIANVVGNFVRGTMDPGFVISGNESLNSVVDSLPNHIPYSAIICRSNTGVFESALEVLDKGGVPYAPKSNEVKKLIMGILSLKSGIASDCPDLSVFSSHEELVEYSDTDEGQQFKRLLKTLDKYGDDFVLETIDSIGEVKPETTTCVMTTHAAKGLEFPTVKIGSDFDVLKFMAEDMTPEELKEAQNVKYVALTRAIKVLDPYEDAESSSYSPVCAHGLKSENLLNPPMVKKQSKKRKTHHKKEAS